MDSFEGKVAVITGAGSGFGREFGRIGARLGMKLVLADVQEDALEAVRAELAASGADVMARRVDVSRADEVEALARAASERYGALHLVFNNAGVGGSGGYVWEASERDWEWVLGVNLKGVIHGVRAFVPRMLEAARHDAGYRGHVINTASMAGVLNAPLMGPYNVSKHAVVSLSETLYHDLGLATQQIGCSVLCPYFVPTGIADSQRNRPAALRDEAPLSLSQRVARELSKKAVQSGKLTAGQIAEAVFDAIRHGAFYIFSHPHALGGVQTRMEDMSSGRVPTDPYAARPGVREALQAALRET